MLIILLLTLGSFPSTQQRTLWNWRTWPRVHDSGKTGSDDKWLGRWHQDLGTRSDKYCSRFVNFTVFRKLSRGDLWNSHLVIWATLLYSDAYGEVSNCPLHLFLSVGVCSVEIGNIPRETSWARCFVKFFICSHLILNQSYEIGSVIPIFTDENAEAQRSSITCPESHS